jgi:hypothetical protein
MRLLLRNRHPWIILGLFTGFWVVASFVPVDQVLVLCNSFVLFAAAGAAIRYVPLALHALRKGGSAAAQHVAIGIVLASGFSAVWRVWSLIWLRGGRADGMVTNDVVAFMLFGLAVGLCYHISVPGRNGRLPWWRIIFVSSIVACSLLLSAALIWWDINTAPLVGLMLPYIPR